MFTAPKYSSKCWTIFTKMKELLQTRDIEEDAEQRGSFREKKETKNILIINIRKRQMKFLQYIMWLRRLGEFDIAGLHLRLRTGFVLMMQILLVKFLWFKNNSLCRIVTHEIKQGD